MNKETVPWVIVRGGIVVGNGARAWGGGVCGLKKDGCNRESERKTREPVILLSV